MDVEPDGSGDNRKYTLNLQVWRPSSTLDQMGSGDYSLVGNNRFTSISLNGGLAESLLPSPSDYIRFQSGDVLGFYVEDANEDGSGVVVLTTDSYTNEFVWHVSATSQIMADCPISAGSGGDLNTMLRGAPVISISTGMYRYKKDLTYSQLHYYHRNIQLSSDVAHPSTMSYHTTPHH